MNTDELEDKVVNRLVSEGLIKRETKTVSMIRWAASIAAAVLIFVSGMLVGGTKPADDYNYIFLLYDGENYVEGDPAQRFKEYGDWMRSIAKQGVHITGEKVDDVATVTENGSSHVEVNNGINGLFFISATSESQAMKIASESPHIKYGGKIEIRKIVNE